MRTSRSGSCWIARPAWRGWCSLPQSSGLYCLKFALQSCSAVLRLLRKAVRDFSYLVVKDLEQIRPLRFAKPATMVGNTPRQTMDELPFKIVNMLGPATR